MIVIRNTTIAQPVSVGSDVVVAWAPIPAGGRLLGVSGELHVMAAEATPTTRFHAYGFSGELVPIRDPDTSILIDSLWDEMVTKTVVPTVVQGTSTVDFDWDTDDISPDVEIGEVDINDLTGLLDPTKEIFAPRLEWMSAAKGTPIAIAAATPDQYTPRSYKRFRSRRRLEANLPSYAMLAVSSPSMDQNADSASTLANAKQWAILENLRNVMNDFWRMNVGLTETGAESPYADISTAVGELVSPSIVDPATALVRETTFTVMCSAEWVLDFPGRSMPNKLEGKNE